MRYACHVWNSLIDPHTWFMQIHIAQRGAINPLIEMLKSSDLQLREMSTFALGRLAQVIITLQPVFICMQASIYRNQP